VRNCWLVVGSPRNWGTAFEQKNIWGLKPTQRHLWESVNEKDTLLFYVTSPVSGIIGRGIVRTKFRQDQPLWPQEIKEKKVIWPLRFEFDVERCLPLDKWQTFKITSRELFPRGGFQALSRDIARQLISKLASLPKGYRVETPTPDVVKETPSIYTSKPLPVEQASPSHEEIKQKLLEIGKLQGYLTDEEYVFDIGKLDVVWRRVERSVPTYVFEVQIGGDPYHALAKLKHAFDLWNSHIFIVASQTDYGKVENLLLGAFHEIGSRARFIELNKLEELHKRKKAYLDLEKELGI
jgi:predicted RNA-binding protein